ncbi:hypothetical protein Tco_0213671 [Tanacetum coccineum]
MENSVEVLKILENKLESMKILENKLESLKLQENQPVDGLMSADVARGHGGDGGGDDYPPIHHIPTGWGGCFINQGKGTRKPNLGGRKAGKLHTHQETRNLRLMKITDDKGPVPIREMTLYYPSRQKVPAEWKAVIVTKIRMKFDLKPHMQSQRWTNINTGIQQHFQKLYNTNKASLKAEHWMESSATREYPSLIHTFFVTHTVNGVFMRDEDQAIYEEMLRLRALGSNTPSSVPYTEVEINALARKGKQRGHLPYVDRMLTQYESTPEFGNASRSGWCGDDEMTDDEDGDEDKEDEEDGDS